MRKLVWAALAAGILSIAAVAIAAAHDDHGTDEWPTTCVRSERHRGRAPGQ